MNRHGSNEDIYLAKKYMKEMHIKSQSDNTTPHTGENDMSKRQETNVDKNMEKSKF